MAPFNSALKTGLFTKMRERFGNIAKGTEVPERVIVETLEVSLED